MKTSDGIGRCICPWLRCARVWCCGLACWLGLLSAGPVVAQELVSAQAYWVDASGQADFAQAQTQTYTPYSGVLALGYIASPTWIRLHIEPRNAPLQDARIVLRIQPQYLDEIALYDPLASPGVVQRTGDSTDYAAQTYHSIAHGFVLPKGASPRDVWLRLQTTSTSQIEIDAFGESRMQEKERAMFLRAYSILALLVVFQLLGIASWAQSRERLEALFLSRSVVYFLLLICFFGLTRAFLYRWIPPAWCDWGFGFLLLVSTTLATGFETLLLAEWRMKTWARWGMWGVFGASCICLCLLLAGHVQLALLLNVGVTIGGSLLGCLVSFVGLRDDKLQGDWFVLQKNYLRAYYLGIAIMMALSLPSVLGFGGPSLPLFLAYGVYSGLALTCLMQYRARQVRHRLHAIQLQMALLQQQAEFEQSRHQAQKQLLALLMHEIKNPLAVIEAAQHQSNAGSEALVRKNVATIRSVLDRSFKLEQIGDGQLLIDKSTFLLSDCLATVIDETGIDESRLDCVNLLDERALHTSEEYVRTMLGNLLGNAFKYGVLNGRVLLTVLRDEARPNHLGMAIANRPGASGWPDPQRVFEKYYRSEGARLTPGTGIGLHLVRALAASLGGECRYLPDQEYVRFELWLPV